MSKFQKAVSGIDASTERNRKIVGAVTVILETFCCLTTREDRHKGRQCCGKGTKNALGKGSEVLVIVLRSVF